MDPNRLIWLPIMVVCFVFSIVLIIYLAKWVQMNDEKEDISNGEPSTVDAHIPLPREVHSSEILTAEQRHTIFPLRSNDG